MRRLAAPPALGRRLARWLLALLVWLPTVALLPPAAPAQAATLPPGFSSSVLAQGLDQPTAMAIAPDGRIFVAQQGGSLRVIRNGVLLPEPFLTVTTDSQGERGLVGMTLDPAFAANGFVYIYYTATTPEVHNRVSRFTAAGDRAAPGSDRILLDLPPLSSATNHNGGALRFGSDGRLFVAVGENADAPRAQRLDNPFGKILRINPDGGIPPDNPFYNATSGINRAIWALGLRNPFVIAVQPGSGRLFINDVGSGGGDPWEEINEGLRGANYGWPEEEGLEPNPRFRAPLFAYPHAAGLVEGCAITGGAFYNPPVVQFPNAYVGQYFFTDLCGGWIRTRDPATGAVADFSPALAALPVDLQVGPDGVLYLLAHGSGTITAIRYAAPVPAAGATDWYFAEGYTGPGFDEYLTIQNANAAPATAAITYYLTGGGTTTRAVALPASSRTTVRVHDPPSLDNPGGLGRSAPGSGHATRVRTTLPTVVERPIYFTYAGAAGGPGSVDGGHITLGATAPRGVWLFAEGYTGPGFDEYLTIMNPNSAPGSVQITYYLTGGGRELRSVPLPANSRTTVQTHMPAGPGNPGGLGRLPAGLGHATRVETSVPTVVERPIYFRYGGGSPGGHTVMGAAQTATAWRFADGRTRAGSDEFLTIMNPGARSAAVLLTYVIDGGVIQKSLIAPANSRVTVAVHEAALGVGRGQEPAVTVASLNGVGIVVERPIYAPGGGDTALGAPTPRAAWLFAEGYTGAGFTEELVLFNAGGLPAPVTLTYYLAGGGARTRSLVIPAHTRRVVDVADPTVGIGPGQAAAVRVASPDAGLVAERVMRFTYDGTVIGVHRALGYAP